ncbi:hypothetical protein EBX93_14105 [bacterium]|nr:hypothetical protein [bacterium]
MSYMVPDVNAVSLKKGTVEVSILGPILQLYCVTLLTDSLNEISAVVAVIFNALASNIALADLNVVNDISDVAEFPYIPIA